MCGIIGYTGSSNALPKITKGLSVLEYRGYDSVGLAATTEEGIVTVKCRGRIGALEERLTALSLEGCTSGIGHTRWATHGGPSDRNAHPHQVGRVTLVHNGIIENYKEIKAEMSANGVEFLSETDTEAAAALIDACYAASGDPVAAILQATARMKGSYAFGVLFEDRPGEVFAIRQGSPLLLARGADGFYLASDLTALLPFTTEYRCLEEGELAHLSPDGAVLLRAGGEKIIPAWIRSTMTPESAQKGGFAHFMCKEMHEEPEAVRKSVSSRIREGLPDFSADGITVDFWRQITGVQIVACGSAMHAGLVGIDLLERVAGIPATCHIASEYRYHPPLAAEGTLVLVISQSGETADTLAALRYAKSVGLPTLAIVNAVETTIAREADRCVYTYAGPEIAVATTKGYCTQLSVLYMLAAAIGHGCGRLSDTDARALVRAVSEDAPAAMAEILSRREELCELARVLAPHDHVFYIGRGVDFAMSEEGALKLKEISYIHAEAYAAGELKHGTISLVEEGTPVIAIATERALYDKTESNVREVQSRGAHVILLCPADMARGEVSATDVVPLPHGSEAATLFAALATVQLLAYETAALRGCDIDRPRNLAKSVTVE
ncbi:MAG: glutamine--fructose-6-phosphate transaminase (isomerizing) [Clostridia bacterium]|nr:glutamine--fructose-6-phosphate transaminase (isomerizing) [Clostridia bacterium]